PAEGHDQDGRRERLLGRGGTGDVHASRGGGGGGDRGRERQVGRGGARRGRAQARPAGDRGRAAGARARPDRGLQGAEEDPDRAHGGDPCQPERKDHEARAQAEAALAGPGGGTAVSERRAPDSITFADVAAARDRIAGVVPRSPLVRLESDGDVELYLKLECLQPVRAFKLRGAYNA